MKGDVNFLTHLGNSLQTCTEADFLFLLPSYFYLHSTWYFDDFDFYSVDSMPSDTGKLSSGRIYL